MFSKTFIKSGLIYSLLEVLNKGLPFILLPFFTRFLSVEEYGLLSLFLILINVLMITVGIGSSGALNANYYRLNKLELALYMGNIIFVLLGTLLLNVLVVTSISMFDEQFDLPILWMVLGVVLAFTKCVNLVYLSSLRMQQASYRFGRFQFLSTIFDAGLTIVGVVFFLLGWEFRALVMLVVSAVGTVFAIGVLVADGSIIFRMKKNYLYEILAFGIPLIPHQLGIWIRTGGDRYLLSILISTVAVGIYSANYQLGFGLAIVMMAFNQAYQPMLYKELSNNPDDRIKRNIVKRTYALFGLIMSGAVLIAYILPLVAPFILGNKEYSEGLFVMPWLSIASGFQGMYLLLVLFILYMKKTFFLSIITTFTAVVHFGLSYYLIERLGMIGAAYASVVSYLIAFILTWLLSHRVYPLPWNPIKLYRNESA